MPLKPVPDQGLELPLGEYQKLRAFQGGGWYWDHHHQQTIRECLGEFLPRVEETGGGERGGALFQHFVHGREAAARSRPIAAGGDRVPRGELRRLHRALETLKRKAADPGTDRDAKRIIESFTLPDPAKDPELYRLHGPPWRRRLLVLWGCEREAGSSVAPAAALGRVPVEATSTTWLRRWPLLLGALLLLLALLLLADLWQNRRRDEPIPAANGPTPTLAAPGTNRGGLAPSSASLAGAPPGAIAPTDRASAANPDPAPGRNSDPAAAGASANPATAGSGATATSGGSSEPASLRPTASPPARLPAAGGSGPAALPAVSPTGSAVSGVPSPADNPANAAASTPRPAAAPPGNSSPPPTAPSPAGSPANAASPAPPDAAVLLPTVTIAARSSPSPKGGKVDMLLTATARGEDGRAAPLTVTGWRVDGKAPPDAARPAEAGQLNLSLPEGPHRVRVTGTANGVPVETEAVVEVQIRSQSDVRVKPGAPPR